MNKTVSKKKYFVRIKWDNDKLQTYYFNSAKEVESFLLGCEQASGCEEYVVKDMSKGVLPCE